MIAPEAFEEVLQLRVGDGGVLRGQVGQAFAPSATTLRSTATPEGKLDRAEEHHQHQRHDEGELCRRKAAAVARQFGDTAPGALPCGIRSFASLSYINREPRAPVKGSFWNHRCRLQQSLVTRQICDVVAKSGDEQRPLVRNSPHNHDSPGIAGGNRSGCWCRNCLLALIWLENGDQPERVVVS